MFSYVDVAIRKDLESSGKLFSLDAHGQLCDPESADAPPWLRVVGPVPLPVTVGTRTEVFQWYAWVRHSDWHRIDQVARHVREKGPQGLFALLTDHMSVNSVLLYGDCRGSPSPLVRVHSNCLTGDVFGSMRCDCGPQLQVALERIRNAAAGALVYMAGHEGRGIGLWAKAITYLLQDAGQDTYQANERLGLPADSRDFSDAGRILVHFCGPKSKIRLLGNNPAKRESLEAAGLVVEQEPLVAGVNEHNVRYLGSKQQHGHVIPDGALTVGDVPARRRV